MNRTRPHRERVYAWARVGVMLFTPSVVACGVTVEVSQDVQDPVFVLDAGIDLDASLPPPLNRPCGTRHPDVSCAAAEVVDCSEDGGQQLVTRQEPLDCDVTRGLTGDPEEVAFDCQAAFNGQSGDGCSGERTCVRRTLVGCCLELATCQGDEPTLLRSRACAQQCLAVSPAVDSSDHFQDCDALLRKLGRPADPYRVQGARCQGDIVCSEGLGEISERELPFMEKLRVFFCVGGRIQVLDALPWFDVPPPDAGTPVPDAGPFDAGGREAGLVDAGLADAGVADAQVGDGGLADSQVPDAGPADAAATKVGFVYP